MTCKTFDMDSTRREGGLSAGRKNQHPGSLSANEGPQHFNYALRSDAGYLVSRIFWQPATSRLNGKVSLTRILINDEAAQLYFRQICRRPAIEWRGDEQPPPFWGSPVVLG